MSVVKENKSSHNNIQIGDKIQRTHIDERKVEGGKLSFVIGLLFNFLDFLEVLMIDDIDGSTYEFT